MESGIMSSSIGALTKFSYSTSLSWLNIELACERFTSPEEISNSPQSNICTGILGLS